MTTSLLIFVLIIYTSYISDLKPANILVFENCNIKICDFGLSRIVSDNESKSPSRGASLAPGLWSPLSKLSTPFPFFSEDSSRQKMESQLQGDNCTSMIWNDGGEGMNISPCPPPNMSLPPPPGMQAVATDGSEDGNTTSDSQWSSNIKSVTANMQNQRDDVSTTDFPMPLPIKRQMTEHVVTRWYAFELHIYTFCQYIFNFHWTRNSKVSGARIDFTLRLFQSCGHVVCRLYICRTSWHAI